MSSAALSDIIQRHIDLVDQINLATNGHGYAASDKPDEDVEKSALYEGYLMRAFISFERKLEDIFLHFACGGQSLSGNAMDCRLTNCNADTVKKILRQGAKFVDWANMNDVRERANLFFIDGKPFSDPLMGKSQELAQIQKIRNRISHDSSESRADYRTVVLDTLAVSPIFEMTPGHLLRTKRKKSPALSMHAHYLGAMTDTLAAICEKP